MAKKRETLSAPAIATAIAKKPTFAEIARANAPEEGPWTMVQPKTRKSLTQDLALKKVIEPAERRIIFTRNTLSTGKINLSDLLLAINLAIKEIGLPDHIRFLRISYTATGAISALLGDKATAEMLCPLYNDTLINTARKFDSAVIGVQKAEQWYKLRIHRVSLERYLATGLNLVKQEIEATQNFTLPLTPFWLRREEIIREKYNQKMINFSIIIITVRNK